MIDLPTPPDRPITRQAARGRFVVLVKAQSWFDARETARAMLGGEPEYVSSELVGFDPKPLFMGRAFGWVSSQPTRRYYGNWRNSV